MLCGIVCAIFSNTSFAKGGGSPFGVELFAKGSYSKNTLSADVFLQNATVTTGLALGLGSVIRLEARFALIESYQNRLDVTSSSGEQFIVTSIHTQTKNYTLGVDIDFLSDKSPFRPFVFIGAGYVESERTYSVSGEFRRDGKVIGMSANGGLGFKIMVARSIAFETEGLAVATNVTKPNPLIDYYLTLGIRVYL